MKFSFLLLVTYLCFSCRSDNIWFNSTAEEVKKEATTTLRQYHKDIAEKGLLAELNYLDSTELFSWHPPGYTGPIGYDSVVSVLNESAPLYLKIDHHWDTLTVLPATKSKVMYLGEVTSIITDTSGRINIHRYKEEGMMIKRADGWKLVSGKTVLIH